jgi:hypothetical protein
MGAIESSQVIYRLDSVTNQKCVRPFGMTDHIMFLTEVRPSLWDWVSLNNGKPGDESPGYFPRSLRDHSNLNGVCEYIVPTEQKKQSMTRKKPLSRLR